MKNGRGIRSVLVFSLVFIAVGSFLIANYYSNLFAEKNYKAVYQNDSETEETSGAETQEAFGNKELGNSPANNIINTEPASEDDDSYLIENFESIIQTPELPTGCEITALTMVLNYYGFDADKITMASDYLPTTYSYFYYGDDGTLYGPDLNNYFVGNPFTTGGYICGTGAIITAADEYLSDEESSMRAVDMTGSSPEELYKLVSEDTPVVVWVTIYMVNRTDVNGWYTESGEYVDWSTSDHGAVLIGYTDDTVTIADPISGIVEYDRQAFESVFASRGNKCVILE